MHGLLAFDNKNKAVSLPIDVTMCSVEGHLLLVFPLGKAHFKLQLESTYYCRKNTHNRLPRSGSPHDAICISLVGASLSEPHIDELHVRNLYIYVLCIMYYVLYMVRPSPARRYIQCTATRDIFRRPHEETSALSSTTCIIIAESAKQIHSVCQNLSRERPS